jgi:hypothetical protein
MSKNIKEMRTDLLKIGDSAKAKYETSLDLKAAMIAIKAYSEVTKTALTQVQYKKLTGTPKLIDFLEE